MVDLPAISAEWLQSPHSALLFAHIENAIESYRAATGAHLRSGDAHKAAISLGNADSLAALHSALDEMRGRNA